MNFYFGLIIIIVLLQASLGLITSVATSLAGHSLGKKYSNKKTFHLLFNYSFGVGLISFLILSTICLILFRLSLKIGAFYQKTNFWYSIIFLLLVQTLVMSLILILNNSANPWTPNKIKHFLLKRSNKTNSTVEAISLGIMTILANFWLVILPLVSLAIFLLKTATIRGILLTSSLIGLISFSVIFNLLINRDINQVHQNLIENRRIFQFLSIATLLILIGLISLFINSYGKMVLVW